MKVLPYLLRSKPKPRATCKYLAASVSPAARLALWACVCFYVLQVIVLKVLPLPVSSYALRDLKAGADGKGNNAYSGTFLPVLGPSRGALLPMPKVKIGTVIRGDEWSWPLEPRKKAVLNALHSLTRCFGADAVVILVDENTSCSTRPSILNHSTCRGLSHCMDKVYGTPTMNCVFSTLSEVASQSGADIIGYINGDILVFNSLARSVEALATRFGRFVMVGRRHNSEEVPSLPSTREDWVALEESANTLPLDGGYAIDYFIVTQEDAHATFNAFPPFIIGTQRWDNALLASLYRRREITVVDATFAAPIIHQGSNPIRSHGQRPAAEYNEVTANHFSGYDFLFGTIDNSDAQIIYRDGSTFITGEAFASRSRVLRCAFRQGLFAPQILFESCLNEWFAHTVKRAPPGVLHEVMISPQIKNTLCKLPSFRVFGGPKLCQATPGMFFYFEERIKQYIFTIERISDSC